MVDLGDFSAADFERTAETIPLGEKAARTMSEKLATLSVSLAEHAAWRSRVTVSQNLEIRVADVQIRGLKYVNPEYLRTVLKVHAGDLECLPVALGAQTADILPILNQALYGGLGVEAGHVYERVELST